MLKSGAGSRVFEIGKEDFRKNSKIMAEKKSKLFLSTNLNEIK